MFGKVFKYWQIMAWYSLTSGLYPFCLLDNKKKIWEGMYIVTLLLAREINFWFNKTKSLWKILYYIIFIILYHIYYTLYVIKHI